MTTNQIETNLQKTSLFDGASLRVFTMPPAVSFLDCLARTLLAELDRPETPFALSDAIILLPTKRAARALGQAFLDARGGAATLLPRIRTLGDIDPDDAGLAELGEAIDATPVIDPLARRLTLARLIRARDKQADWSDDPVAALGAADALSELLDSAAMTASGDKPFDWTVLETLVEDKELAAHWEQSTTFLQIVTSAWPAYLEQLDMVDPGVRQRRGIESLIATWRDAPPKGAVILAGSTGSMPVTRALMACVARLPMGAVVLPGLDVSLKDDGWAAARHDDQHPQRAMAEAIEAIGVTRADVRLWPEAGEATALRQRRVVLNEALTPQESTADWPSRIKEIGEDNIALGLQGISLVEAATEEEEANVIALELRETLQEAGKTAALVTPDSNIARRVAAKLARWNIAIDVSAGQPLGETPVGAFVRLVAAWASDPADPVLLASLLGHPYACLGYERTQIQVWASCLEISLLRGARKDKSLLEMMARANTLLPKEWKAIGAPDPEETISQTKALIASLNEALIAAGEVSGTLDVIAQSVITLCEAIATTPTLAGSDILWRGEAGEAGAQFFGGLMAHGAAFDPVAPHQVARTLDCLMAGRVVRPRGTHPRLAILGPLEARLLRYDKIVLAGLDEGVWPKPPAPDPFLSRAMRAKLGFPSPDTRIGLSAHDFAQLASAPLVVMTRASRRNDTPAVMSRWLWRLKTLTRGALGEEGADAALSTATNWRDRLRHYEPNRTFDTRLAIPAPKPPVYARPTEFSATQIETWIRDPYRTYVEKVLKLRALDPLGGEPGSGERGSAIHAGTEIVGAWIINRPADAHEDVRHALRAEMTKAGYDGVALEAEMRRLEPSIAWLATTEIARLDEGWHPYIEKWGQIELETKAGPVTIKAKADRIDVGPTGVEVIDFKSGTPATAKQVMTLLSAQLPVTALIVARGGYKEVSPQVPSDLRHVHIGGRKVAEVGAVHKDTSIEQLVADVETTIVKLFQKYSNPEWAYLSKPRIQFIKATTYEDATDRLARRAEWANVDAGE
jgi:ATP-dependent helicase/nuclease subunit B